MVALPAVLATVACQRRAGALAPTSSIGAGTGASDAPAPRAAPPPPPRISSWATLFLSGGGHPSANAVAHERNISFAGRSLDAMGLPRAKRTVLFADGDDPGLDLQLEETDAARHRRLYALGLYRGVEGAHDAVLRYRDHELGPTERADLDTVKRTLADDAVRAHAPTPASPLLLYVTDHGLEERDRSNNTILLWNDERLSVRQLGTLLDTQPPARRVVTVMAQCFSGSFSSLVHLGGDPRSPLAPHDRCGFFAAPKDRPAAGCSPRSDESLYDDYTTRFFAALAGQTRTGSKAPPADLDADGVVTLEEAHYAATILEDTMDVPVSTTEELLRRERGHWLSGLDRDAFTVQAVLAAGRPALRRVGAELARSLGIDPTSTTIAALDRALREADEGCHPGFCEAIERAGALRSQISRSLGVGAPFPRPTDRPDLTLALAGSARVDQWIAERAPDFDELLRVEAEVLRLRVQSESLEGRRLRLVRLLERVWLERVLRLQHDPLEAAFDKILACERSRLDLPAPSTPETGPQVGHAPTVEPPMEASVNERRITDRAPIDLFLNKYIDGYPYLCRAKNLSWGGLLVETQVEPAHKREFFSLEIELPGFAERLWLWTRPVWTRGRMQAHRIVGIDTRDEAMLAQYLALG